MIHYVFALFVVGDWLVSVLNANSHTFEVAPVFTLMETELLKKFSNIIGGDFAGKCEGLFVPGGSISNLYALQLARFRYTHISFTFVG